MKLKQTKTNIQKLAMIKRITCFVFFVIFFSQVVMGQQTVQITEFVTDGKRYEGKIGDYDISMYLQSVEGSPGHRNIYSVKGWYYYEKYQKKISLVGIRDLGKITLYHFEEKGNENAVLNFKLESDGGFWDDMELYHEISDWNEKIVLTDTSFSGKVRGNWKSQTSTLPFLLYEADLRVQKQKALLKIQSDNKKHVVSLGELGIFPLGNTLRNYKWVGKELVILLDFEHPSRAYALGMCGAGSDSGIILLRFDQDFQLVEIRKELLSSCVRSFAPDVKQLGKGIVEYRVRDFQDKLIKVVTLDEKRMTMKVQE